MVSFIKRSVHDENINRNRSQKSILVIGDENLFWKYLHREEFDLGRQETKIRFFGESGVGEDGLLVEFLTLAKRLSKKLNQQQSLWI